MKTFIFVLCAISATAWAESVTFQIPPFTGTVFIRGQDYEVTGVAIEASNQFCEFWDKACSGGPTESTLLNVLGVYERQGEDTVVHLRHFETLRLKSSKLGYNFSSCNLTVHIYTTDATGVEMHNQFPLITTKDRVACASTESVAALLENEFAERKVHNVFPSAPYAGTLRQ